jgi:hypothetical protein
VPAETRNQEPRASQKPGAGARRCAKSHAPLFLVRVSSWLVVPGMANNLTLGVSPGSCSSFLAHADAWLQAPGSSWLLALGKELHSCLLALGSSWLLALGKRLDSWRVSCLLGSCSWLLVLSWLLFGGSWLLLALGSWLIKFDSRTARRESANIQEGYWGYWVVSGAALPSSKGTGGYCGGWCACTLHVLAFGRCS